MSSALGSPSKDSTGKGVKLEVNVTQNIVHNLAGGSVKATTVFLRIIITGIAWVRASSYSSPFLFGST